VRSVSASRKLELGYTVSKSNIPSWLDPLIQDIVLCYKTHHPDLVSVYVVGSAGHGDMKKGISDIDIVGITASPASEHSDSARRAELDKTGALSEDITFIDNSLVSEYEIVRNVHDSKVRGCVFKLSTTGVCVWGREIDVNGYSQSVHDVAYGRVDRAEALMEKYRSGNLIEAFRKDDRLLARSCAKAAMRVLSSMTILRGAKFQASPYRVADEVGYWVPEAIDVKNDAMKIINNPDVPSSEAMEVADRSIELFRRVFPVD
jgi:hypothetical protein